MHTLRDKDLTTPQGSYSILTLWMVCMWGGSGGEGRLPLLRWGTHLTPTYPLRLVVGQRQPHILLSFQGTSLQGLPQGPSEGARSASENSWNPPPGGASLETEPPVSVLGSQLNCLQCCCRGFQDVRIQLGAPYHQGTPAQRSRREALAETLPQASVSVIGLAAASRQPSW